MIQTLRVVRRNWRQNHRHHGGARAAARCLLGTLAVRAGLLSRRRSPAAAVEVLTFSVVPWMTALWARLLRHVLAGRDAEILIGDCSGGLGRAQRRLMAGGGTRLIPCLNEHHGDKIDLFLEKLCHGRYVVIADDDVFWLDDRPLAWALAQLDADPQVAAVSLLPRYLLSKVLEKDDVPRAMGSHCLVIRRRLWRRERLSFAVVPAPPGEDWLYDTGDFANRELLRRGFRVVIAEPEMGRHLVAFDGVSSWILKLQGQAPDRLAASVGEIPARLTKAQQAVYFARGLSRLLVRHELAQAAVEVVPAARLDAAERVLNDRLAAPQRAEIRDVVDAKLRRIEDRLRRFQAT